jgi:hypothetical protein
MPAISYKEWSGGLDRRLSINSQEANRLWELRNAYITLGKRIKKRPGLRLVTTGLTGSTGLKAVNRVLRVFVDRGSAFVAPTPPSVNIGITRLDNPFSGPVLDRIHYADFYQGFLYVVARYDDDSLQHHYIDSLTATVTISNAAPGVVTWTGHTLTENTGVKFTTTGTLPNPLVAGTVYYVQNPAANTFELSATVDGASITTTTAGAGVHTATVPTYITDPNCPQTSGITKAASRIFAPSEENVRYNAVGAARDWTTTSDAGFLPAGLQQDTRSDVQACGTFQDSLVVLFEDGAQIWDVATDPAANVISKRLYGIGTEEPLSLASFFSDLVLLSPHGFRSMTVQAQTDRIDDNDVGVPIDPLVQDDIATMAALANPRKVIGIWIAELGQYWAMLDMGTYSKVWAYTFSRSSKIACWSEYVFPVVIEAITTLAGKIYLRSEDNLYEVAADQYTDDDEPIAVEVQMAFQDAKTPGVAKQFHGADMVSEGSVELTFLYDPRDTAKETVVTTVPGDTRPGDVIPVEVIAPALAPIFRHSADEAMGVDALTIYFHPLSTAV